MIKLIDKKPAEEPAAEELAPTWKKTIFDRVKDGKVIPIIGNAYVNRLLFDKHDELIRYYASETKSAEPEDAGEEVAHNDRQALSTLAQYQVAGASSVVTVKQNYLNVIKNGLRSAVDSDQIKISDDKKAELAGTFKNLTFSELCEFVNYPDLSDKKHPVMLLTALPLPIFVTTSYHDFLERALREHGRDPVVGICNWNEHLELPPVFEAHKDYEPSVERPLVYHLHGVDSDAVSLVLTEDDHLDFMANVRRALPAKLTSALRRSSLVVLGYRLHDLDFKVLFRGIIKEHRTLKMESVAIQLEKKERDRAYLEQYLQKQASFEVEWATDPGDFIKELFREGRP